MNLNSIPNELKVLNQFVGHKNKIPIDLKTGRPASSTNPSTWCSFQWAIANYTRYGADGIGFVFKPPYIGVDLDDCCTPEGINPFGNKIIETLNSYTEYSPSGTGVHIICKGDLQRAVKTTTHEIYNQARYFTMTGNVIRQQPIKLLTSELKDLGLVSVEQEERNKQGWIKESLARLQPGNLHNESVRIIGRLHEDGWEQGDIVALLQPHIERVGGDTKALLTRVESISRYPRAKNIVEEALQDQSSSLKEFLSVEEKVEWIIPGILQKQSIAFMAGLPETCKTWILLDLAIEAARGGYWLKKFPVKQVRTMFINQERTNQETRRRIKAILEGKNVKSSEIEDYFLTGPRTSTKLDLPHSFEAFDRRLEKEKPELVIIDSFKTFHTRNELSPQDMQGVMDKLNTLRDKHKCTFMFIYHEPKNVISKRKETGEVAYTDASGVIDIPQTAETFFNVVFHGDKQSMLYHTKNTVGDKISPILVKVEDLNEQRTAITVIGY